MPSRKSRLTQGQKAAVPKLARLKKLGLFKGNSKRPSKYAIKQTKVFADVLSGKAAVVKTPKRKDAASFKDVFRVRGNKVIVPKERGEHVKYNPKSKTFSGTRKSYGVRIKRIVHKGDLASLPAPPPGKKYLYSVPFGQGKNAYRIRFDDLDEMRIFMQPYETSRRPYRDWQRFVEIEIVSDDVDPLDYDDAA